MVDQIRNTIQMEQNKKKHQCSFYLIRIIANSDFMQNGENRFAGVFKR